MTDVTRLKRVARLVAGGTPSVDDPDYWSDDGVPWVVIGDMSGTDVVRSTGRRVTPAGIRARSLPIGDPGTVLFAMYASVGAVSVLGVSASWNQAILGIEPIGGKSDGRFLKYWLEHLRPALGALMRSNTQDNLNAEVVGQLPFPKVGLTTQRAIADFLDVETARIDALIERKRRLAPVLSERLRVRAATLTSSRGSRLTLRRVVSRVQTGTTPPADVFEQLQGDEVAWYSPGDVADLLEIQAPQRRLSRRAVEEGWVPEFPRDSTVIVGIGATAGRVGYLDHPATGNQQMTCISTCGDFHGRFLAWQLYSRQDELRATAPYTTLPILNNDFLRSIQVVAPPLGVQKSIAAELDLLANANKRLASSVLDQVSLLSEHRQALITATVTGEIDIEAAA